MTTHIKGKERLWGIVCWSHSTHPATAPQSTVANNYKSCWSVTEHWGRSFFHMSASGGSLPAKEPLSQAVTVTNLAWHQADLQCRPTLSTDWLEVIDLEQWRHLLQSMKPSEAPPTPHFYKVRLHILNSIATCGKCIFLKPEIKGRLLFQSADSTEKTQLRGVFSVRIAFHIFPCAVAVLQRSILS